jgi:hypothetical protein
MAHHRSPFLGLVALGLLAVCGLPEAASAAEPRQKPGAQLNHAPVRQRAVSTAVGIGGDAFAAASNQSLGLQNSSTTSGGRQIHRSPTVQTAVSAAVSVGGNSAALASNNGAALEGNPVLGGTRPIPVQQLGRAPRTTAVSTAVSIDGVPLAAAR